MSLSTALVSIYIPTKNRPQLLQRAVKSCLAQTYANLDIIIVDDGSDLVNWHTNQHFAKTDSRITLLRHSSSLGAPASRNNAIYAAKGQYITGLDDDDEFAPERIEAFLQQSHLLQSHAALCSGYSVFNRKQRYTYAKTSTSITLDKLLYANYVGCQIFTLTSRLQAIGGFDTHLTSCQDYDTWLRLANAFGPIKRLANTSYHLYQDHGFARISDDARVAEGYQAIMNKHAALMTPQHKKTQQLNLVAQTGRLPIAPVFSLPLAEQWRFFKIMARQRLISLQKGIHR